MVEVSFHEEISRLSALSGVPGAKVLCKPHTNLYQSRGVVFCKELLRYSEERLLQDEGVAAMLSFRKKGDGVITPTSSLQTFNSLVLPPSIHCVSYNLPEKMQVPNARICFHFQSLDHVARSYRRLQRGLPLL